MTRSWAIFWTDDNDRWPVWDYYAQARGATPEEAVANSHVQVDRPKATKLAVLPWDEATLFTRGGFVQRGDDE